MNKQRLRKLLLYQRYISFCIERELGISGGAIPARPLNKGAEEREVDKNARNPADTLQEEDGCGS